MLSILLGYSGIDVSSAGSIAEAIREAKNNKFDAYLLDSRFPDGDGNALCRQLLEINPHVPVVFYSGDGGTNDKKKGLAAGAGAYLVKPQIDKIAPTILHLVGNNGSDPASVRAS
jgi:two-component system sensor histidine kinase and response regulator WspE